jgi:hypothetical protein
MLAGRDRSIDGFFPTQDGASDPFPGIPPANFPLHSLVGGDYCAAGHHKYSGGDCIGNPIVDSRGAHNEGHPPNEIVIHRVPVVHMNPDCRELLAIFIQRDSSPIYGDGAIYLLCVCTGQCQAVYGLCFAESTRLPPLTRPSPRTLLLPPRWKHGGSGECLGR